MATETYPKHLPVPEVVVVEMLITLMAELHTNLPQLVELVTPITEVVIRQGLLLGMEVMEVVVQVVSEDRQRMDLLVTEALE